MFLRCFLKVDIISNKIHGESNILLLYCYDILSLFFVVFFKNLMLIIFSALILLRCFLTFTKSQPNVSYKKRV